MRGASPALAPLHAVEDVPAFAVSTLRLGMPELALGALSETWALKACGHRHWTLLAAAAGLPVPDFRDADGRPVYAAFSAVGVDASGFDRCREHDPLAVASRVVRLSRTRFASEHRLAVDGRPVGRITMTSVFVRRRADGGNRTILRTELSGLPPADPDDPLGPEQEALAAPLKARAALPPDTPRLVLHPVPSLDFNGADFLYFASFVAFAERAEHALAPASAARPLVARSVVFHGNVDVGEALAVAVGPAVDGERAVEIRAADGRPLADMTVRRR